MSKRAVLRGAWEHVAGECVMDNRRCPSDLNYILLQINVICLLLALISSTVIVKHPSWFGKGADGGHTSFASQVTQAPSETVLMP